MTLVLFSDDFTLEGYLSVARRHGSEDRVRDWCERVDASDAVGEEIPGNFVILEPRLREPTRLRWVLFWLGLMPEDTATFVQTTPRPDGSTQSEVISVPVPSDLDATGACRCGCGYTAPLLLRME